MRNALNMASLRGSLPLLLLWAGIGAAQTGQIDKEIRDKESNLQQIRRQIDGCRQELDQLQGKEASALASLNLVDKELSLLHELLNELEVRQNELEGDISARRGELSVTRERLAGRRAQLARRLREAHKRGGNHLLEILFTADSPVDLFRRYRYVQAIAEAERTALTKIAEEEARLVNLEKDLSASLARTRSLQEEKIQEEERTVQLQGERSRQLTMVRTRRDASQQAMTELQEEVSVLEEIIARLEKQRLELARKKPKQDQALTLDNFARLQGQLPWPTDGAMVSCFGAHKHPVFKTTTINQGIDIQAPPGTDINAVAPGEVIIIDWLRGYGKFLILDHHDGYYTLYAHASEIMVEVGEAVLGGQCIARVGETGSLQGPLLHFEIRKGQKELDPLLWLTRR